MIDVSCRSTVEALSTRCGSRRSDARRFRRGSAGVYEAVGRAGRSAHSVAAVARHVRFEDFRYVGDRDAQRVYDQDTEDEVTGEVVARPRRNQARTAFSPDTLAEARNRG